MKKNMLMIVSLLLLSSTTHPISIMDSLKQKLHAQGKKLPTLSDFKKNLKKWTSYEQRMWDCGRGNIVCSQDELRSVKKWFIRNLTIILIALYGVPFYLQWKKGTEERKKWEEAAKEGLEKEEQRKREGYEIQEYFELTDHQVKKLLEIHESLHYQNPEPLRSPHGLVPWYRILNVDETASQSDIARKYKQISRATHPDLKSGYEDIFTFAAEAKKYGIRKGDGREFVKKPTAIEWY